MRKSIEPSTESVQGMVPFHRPRARDGGRSKDLSLQTLDQMWSDSYFAPAATYLPYTTVPPGLLEQKCSSTAICLKLGEERESRACLFLCQEKRTSKKATGTHELYISHIPFFQLKSNVGPHQATGFDRSCANYHLPTFNFWVKEKGKKLMGFSFSREKGIK